ncbi:MAG TPA: endolytic transglycosylase MltG, partial [Acidimicrobiia bacterium]|nr:endolytic transglycosylase MltG [Acidimicrobiia bacterium]
MSKIAATIGLVVLAGIAVVGGGAYLGRLVGSTFNSDDPSAAPVSVQPGQDVTIEVPSGSTAEDIGAILAAQGVVRSALEFEVAVRNNEADARLQAGTYAMQTVMDPNEVVAMLVVGPVA